MKPLPEGLYWLGNEFGLILNQNPLGLCFLTARFTHSGMLLRDIHDSDKIQHWEYIGNFGSEEVP